jgi:hypothetical protein
MKGKRGVVYLLWLVVPALLLLLPVLSPAQGAPGPETLLPPVTCGAGWSLAGKPELYDRESLSDRINGEAELYFPYGFDRMAAARYGGEKSPGAGMDVEIYRMGSPLDAFGIYGNYRQKEGRGVAAGAESNLSGSQLFFYQGAFFIHIQLTGGGNPEPDTLVTCARAVAARLPGTSERPAALAVLERPEIIRGSERYLPQSILGYDFLNRGFMADAVVAGATLQLFLLPGPSPAATGAAFDRYRAQLGQVQSGPGGAAALFLEGLDPLYGPVMLLRRGSCLAGALRYAGKKELRLFLESLCP